MPPTISPGLILASTHIVHAGIPRATSVTYAVATGGSLDDPTEWADILQNFFAGAWSVHLDSGATITGTTVVFGDGSEDFGMGESTDPPTVGGNAGEFLPPNCAALIKKRTGVGGKRNRGRVYIPWVMKESEVGEDGSIENGRLTGLQTSANNWLQAINALDSTSMVIANRFYNAPWDDPDRELVSIETGNSVTSLLAERFIATQRRRMARPT